MNAMQGNVRLGDVIQEGHTFQVTHWDDTQETVTVVAVDRVLDLVVVEFADGERQRMSLTHMLSEENAQHIPDC